MWSEDLVEKRIREAMARGDFSQLRGQGQPQNHDTYFAVPEDQRLAYAVLHNAGYLPPEVQLLNEIAAMRERLAQATDDEERRRLNLTINEKRLHYDLILERYRRLRRRAAE